MLRNTGLRLSNFVNDRVFISRSGGEEFAIVIFENTNAENLIQKIKTSVSDVCNGCISVTLSIGVATKQKKDSSSSIITAADNALYQAKRVGRDRIMYAPRSYN